MRLPKQGPLAFGGALFLAGVLFWSLHYLASGTLERNAKVVGMVTGVAGSLIAAATLAFSILQQRHAQAAAGTDEAEQRARAAETLATAVRRQWEEEAQVRILRRPAPLRLHWWTTERPVAPSAATIVGEDAIGGRVTRLRLHGHSEEVGEKFVALPRRRLVVLGRPGAGKTVLVVLLTLDLLDRRHPGDPVPVLLSLSTWDPTGEHLHAWMARRLLEDYPALGSVAAYGPAAAQRLVVSGNVLPILDGLDEMPPGLRAVAIGELDRAHADRPLVLTCRSEEYEEAVTTSGELLAAAAVVELLPVSVEEAIRFLQRAIAPEDTRWEEVFGHLRADPDGALAAALSSPLMVALARTIYNTAPDREPRTLVAIAAAGGQAAAERHLLDNLVPAVYAHRPPAPGLPAAAVRRRWEPDLARRYLAFLARHLHERDARELAWWELHRAMPVPVRLALGLVFGLGLAPVVVLVAWFLPTSVGPVLGLLAWLVVVLWFLRGKKPSPSRMSFRIRGRTGELARSVRRPIAVSLALGLLAGYLITVASAFRLEEGGLLLWLVLGLSFGLAGGLGVGLVKWLRRPADYALAVTPHSVLRSDRTVAPMVWLVSFVLLVLVSGFLFWFLRVLIGSEPGDAFPGWPTGDLLSSFRIGFWVALYVWLVGGPVAALVLTAWGWFVLARTWLALRGRVPWRLMTFLDDAHHRGVLRQTGATYQFRHARLQEHLATQPGQGRHPTDVQTRTLRV